MAEVTVARLLPLISRGFAQVPEDWNLTGPAAYGLWWSTAGQEVVATPLLLRLAAGLPSAGERAGLLLATEERFREPWLDVCAARLAQLGQRERLADLCRQISELGAAARALKTRVLQAASAPASTPASGRAPAPSHAAIELALFKAPADQSAAAPGLVRVLGTTAALIEGGQGRPAAPLEPVDRRDPTVNWIAGRLVQSPVTGSADEDVSEAVLLGAVSACPAGDANTRMAWVLETPWATLLAVLVFTMEAWAAERQGGLALELPGRLVEHFARPPRVDVVVTLADGQEVLCGSLGELCLRVLDALGMGMVPMRAVDGDPTELDQRLGPVIAELLRAGVWRFRAEEQTRYEVGEDFGYDCYRGGGHRHIFLGSESLSQTLRGVAVTWARTRVEQAALEIRT